MDFVVASPTKSNAVRNLYTQFRSIFPRLNMVDDSLVLFRNVFTTMLTHFVISSQTHITPLNVLPIIKLSFGIKNGLRSFSNTLFTRVRFISTISRTVISSIFLIGIDPKSSCTSIAVSKKALFFHNNRSILGYE